MSEKNYKQKHMDTPIERHESTPITNIENAKHISRVIQPSEEAVEYAKGWVDMNEK
jgi:hypothetical protein